MARGGRIDPSDHLRRPWRVHALAAAEGLALHDVWEVATRLPQDVSHQNVHRRVGIVVEVDESGAITACSSTLLMDLARDFFARLLIGRSVVTERPEIEAAVRESYLGHSQAALLFALHQVFEAVDLSAPFGTKGRGA